MFNSIAATTVCKPSLIALLTFVSLILHLLQNPKIILLHHCNQLTHPLPENSGGSSLPRHPSRNGQRRANCSSPLTTVLDSVDDSNVSPEFVLTPIHRLQQRSNLQRFGGESWNLPWKSWVSVSQSFGQSHLCLPPSFVIPFCLWYNITKMRRLQWFIAILGMTLLLGGELRAQWNQDETPKLPADFVLLIYQVNKTYYDAVIFHNKKFSKKWNEKYRGITRFGKSHRVFYARWVGMEKYLTHWMRRKAVDASSAGPGGIRIRNIETIQLGVQTRRLLWGLVGSGEEAGLLIRSRELQKTWREFLKKVEKLEDAIEELKEW